jgi:protein involved in polysaccharide export with SLBB domain
MISLIRIAVLALASQALVFAQTAAPKPANGAMFKQPQVGMNNSGTLAVASQPALRIGASGGSGDAEALEEKRATLETELRYAKTKLDAAQKKLAVQSAAGNADQVEKLNTEIKDWEARIKASQDQLATVESELSRTQPTATVTNSDTVLPGENLEIFVNEDQSFNGRYQVRRGGYIILPQVGRVAVAGKSIDQVEAAVKRALENSQLTRATVVVERLEGRDIDSGMTIYLAGEFKNPRPFKVPQGTAQTLVSVILSSGGVTERADLTRVRVMRMSGGRSVVEEVNVQRILDGQGLASDISLVEGDVITIPTGPASQVFVTGNVKRQGAIEFQSGERLTVYGAILRAGGFARFAKESGVHILRPMPDGTKRKIDANVTEVKKGRKQDVVVLPNDIVVVPEKFFSF